VKTCGGNATVAVILGGVENHDGYEAKVLHIDAQIATDEL